MTQEITSRHEAAGPLDKIIIYSPTLRPAQLGPARPGSASLGLGLLLACRRVPVASLLGLDSASTRPGRGQAAGLPYLLRNVLFLNSYMVKGSKGKTPNSSLKSTSIVAVIATYSATYSSPRKSIVHISIRHFTSRPVRRGHLVLFRGIPVRENRREIRLSGI